MSVLRVLFALIRSILADRAELVTKNLALRQQLAILEHKSNARDCASATASSGLGCPVSGRTGEVRSSSCNPKRSLTLIISVSGDAPAGTDCTCKVAELHNGWCDACKVGYVAGVEIKSEMLFEALDAHGHHIDPDLMKCESCQKALKSDGFCERCKCGFVAEELYYTKLTYYLAKAQTKDTAKINCSMCKKHLGKGGSSDGGNRRRTGASLLAGREGNCLFLQECTRTNATVGTGPGRDCAEAYRAL